MHGVNKEVCWGVGGGQGSCGKRYGGVGGYVGKYVGVWGEVRKDQTKHRMGPHGHRMGTYGTVWALMGTVWALIEGSN